MEQMRTLASTYQILQESSVTAPDGSALLTWAVKGMLHGVDPDGGEYFTEEEFAEFKAGSKPGMGAAGLELRMKGGRILLAPVEGGPAVEAGVLFGDELHAIDSIRIRGMEMHEITKLLSGPKDSRITLTVFRESTLSVLRIPVERKIFDIPGPAVTRPAPGVALLRIPAFRSRTLDETATALHTAWRSEPFKALILDLRGCPGGLVEASVGIAAMFLPPDVVVATSSGNSSSAQTVFRATKAYYSRAGADPLAGLPQEVRDLPLAVLVDEGTAAGAEIVAAALKDHKRATVYGRRSFGRGSIQTITPISRSGAIKYTSAYWTSPSGERIHGVGVVPDTITADGSSALQPAVSALQSSQSRSGAPSGK